jgi:hypothetical protein
LIIVFWGQSAIGDEECEKEVCIKLELMIGSVTYWIPPEEFEFEVVVPDLPESEDRVTVYVHLTRRIGDEDVTIHSKKIKVKKKDGSDTASRISTWSPIDSEDKKGKAHRLIVEVKLDGDDFSDKTEQFIISWSDE